MNNIKLNSAVAFPTRLDLEPYTKAGLEARHRSRRGGRRGSTTSPSSSSPRAPRASDNTSRTTSRASAAGR